MKVRYEPRVGEPINTRHGIVELDELGNVTNLKELDCTAKDLLTVPGFIDADLFPAPRRHKSTRTSTVPEPEPEEEERDIDAETREVFENLLTTEDVEKTAEGYVTMEVLNKALEDADLPIMTGDERTALQDEFEKPEEEKPEEEKPGDAG